MGPSEGRRDLESASKRGEPLTFGCGEVVLLLAFGAVFGAVIVGSLGFTLPSGSLGDVTGLLFGAASVAMFVLSFLVAIVAIFGWQELRRTVVERVAEEARAGQEDIEHQINSRVHAGLALILGRTCREERGLEVKRGDLVDAAIKHCRLSIAEFRKTKRMSEERFAVVRNNLAFYLAIRGAAADASYALQLADELGEWAANYEGHEGSLTLCLVALRYSTEGAKREDVRKVLRQIRDDPAASQHEKKEAEEILASFPEQTELEMHSG